MARKGATLVDITDLPEEFQDMVEIDDRLGCWFWEGKETANGYPAYRRRAAWVWAYEQVYGPIKRNSHYKTIDGCDPALCANPEHRVGLPKDQANTRHRCSVCQCWHEIGEDAKPQRFRIGEK